MTDLERFLNEVGVRHPTPPPLHTPVAWPWVLEPRHAVSAPVAQPGEF